MGVDISHIIRNNFHKVKDIQASKRYTIATAIQLHERLHCPVSISRYDVSYNDELAANLDLALSQPAGESSSKFNIYLGRYDAELTLHNGFWQVETFDHYCQIVNGRNNNRFLLREKIADIARALDEHEIWYAEESYTCNCSKLSEEQFHTIGLEAWVEFAKEQGMMEFDPKIWLSPEKLEEWPNNDYSPLFHDDLTEYDRKMADLKMAWPDYEFVGIWDIISKYIVVRDGTMYLLDTSNGCTEVYEDEETNQEPYKTCAIQMYEIRDTMRFE